VEDKIGKVAYKLNLPAAAQIHHTFHVSQLKQFKGTLPPKPHIPGWLQGRDVDVPLKPVAVLGRKMVKKGNKAAVQFLVQWEGQSPEDASWQDADNMIQRFPDLTIWTS